MLWSIAAAGGVGVLLGLKFRIASVIAASLGLAIVVAATAAFRHWEPFTALKIGIVSLLSLQLAYLLGLMLAGLYHRAGGTKLRRPSQMRAALDADSTGRGLH